VISIDTQLNKVYYSLTGWIYMCFLAMWLLTRRLGTVVLLRRTLIDPAILGSIIRRCSCGRRARLLSSLRLFDSVMVMSTTYLGPCLVLS